MLHGLFESSEDGDTDRHRQREAGKEIYRNTDSHHQVYEEWTQWLS